MAAMDFAPDFAPSPLHVRRLAGYLCSKGGTRAREIPSVPLVELGDGRRRKRSVFRLSRNRIPEYLEREAPSSLVLLGRVSALVLIHRPDVPDRGASESSPSERRTARSVCSRAESAPLSAFGAFYASDLLWPQMFSLQ